MTTSKQTPVSTHLIYLVAIVLAFGLSRGLAQPNGPSPQDDRPSLIEKIGNWLPFVRMFRSEPPPVPPAGEPSTMDVEKLYQTLPDYVVNAPIERECNKAGMPMLDHGDGW